IPNSCAIFPAGARRLQMMRHRAPTRCLSMISAQTLKRLSAMGKPDHPLSKYGSVLFPDHALAEWRRHSQQLTVSSRCECQPQNATSNTDSRPQATFRMMRQNPTKANAAFTGIDVQRMVLRTGPFDGV